MVITGRSVIILTGPSSCDLALCRILVLSEILYDNNCLFYYLVMCVKPAPVANSVVPHQMPHSVASDLDLLCVLRPLCSNTVAKYGKPMLILK